MSDRPSIEITETRLAVETAEPPPVVIQISETRTEVLPETEGSPVEIVISELDPASVEVLENHTEVEVSGENVVVVTPASMGLQGPPGEPRDLVVADHLAGETLGGHRGVIVGIDNKLYYADQANPAHFNRVLGITTGAAAQENPASVRVGGKMTEPSWNWDLERFIYLGTNGILTQTPPAGGFLLEMGWPINPTTILVDIKLPLFLA